MMAVLSVLAIKQKTIQFALNHFLYLSRMHTARIKESAVKAEFIRHKKSSWFSTKSCYIKHTYIKRSPFSLQSLFATDTAVVWMLVPATSPAASLYRLLSRVPLCWAKLPCLFIVSSRFGLVRCALSSIIIISSELDLRIRIRICATVRRKRS